MDKKLNKRKPLHHVNIAKNLRWLVHLFMILAFLSCGGGSDETSDPDPPSAVDWGVAGDGRLDEVLEEVMDAYGIPALAGVLIQGDEIVEMGAVGICAEGFTENVTTENRWHIGSLTKAMTATLAARLIKQGYLSWDTTIADVFPDFVGVIRPEYEDLRLEELLYHTAGLTADLTETSWRPTIDDDTSPIPEQRRKLAAEILELAPEETRGTHLYSNAGYVVVGSMLEEITGRPWEELLVDEVFAPLNMTRSGFGAPGSEGSRDEPWGHQFLGDSNWEAIEPGPYAGNFAVAGPSGSVHTTLEDYAKFMATHLAGSQGEEGLVSSESFVKLHTAADGTDYAMGWGVVQRAWAEGRALQHSGTNRLWLANVWLVPNRNFAMFAVTNAGGDDAFFATDDVMGAFITRFNAAFGAAGD